MDARFRIPRPVLVLMALVAAYAIAQLLGAESWLRVDRVQAWARSFGPAAPVVFTLIIVVSVVAQIPGVIFVVATPALFPPWLAIVVSVVGGNLAANANFALVRLLGGKAALPESGGLIDRAFTGLTTRPIRAVAVIRLVGLMFPPLTAALALTPLRARDHALGTLLGLTVSLGTIVAVESALFG